MKMNESGRLNEIKRLHEEVTSALRTSLANAIKIGELLMQQKKELNHGEFGDWIKTNLPFSWQTANSYMKVFENRKELSVQSG